MSNPDRDLVDQHVIRATVRQDRIEVDVWGWAEGYTSWLVDHVVIAGSPRERAVSTYSLPAARSIETAATRPM